MYAGFLTISEMFIRIMQDNKTKDGRRIAIEPTAALRKVFSNLPKIADVVALPYSDAHGELVKSLNKMAELKQDLENLTPLDVTMTELLIIKDITSMIKSVFETDEVSLNRMVGEHFTEEKKKKLVFDFLWDLYVLSYNAGNRTYDVRSDVKPFLDVKEIKIPKDLLPAIEDLLPALEAELVA
jgi:hypothetical protein